MNDCPILPVTGGSTTSLVLVAAALITVGALLVVAVRWRRHAVVPVVVALAVAVAVLAGAGQSQAATPCPSTTTAPASSTTTSSSSTTEPESTTSSPTTTLLVAADAVDDFFEINVGSSSSGNILANDILGTPAATLDLALADTIGGFFSVFEEHVLPDQTDRVTPVAQVTVSADGSIEFTGLAPGLGTITYAIGPNGRATSVGAVHITVSSTTTTTSPTTTSSTTTTSTTTTSTTLPLIAPVAVNDEASGIDGVPLTVDLLANDQRGQPSAVLVGLGVSPPCVTGGINNDGVSVTFLLDVPGICSGTYTIENSAGSSTASFTITFETSLPLAPPVAVDDNATATVNQSFDFNVMDNDNLGNPEAVFLSWTPNPACLWLQDNF